MNDKRRTIYSCIKKHQPIYLRDIQKKTGLPYGTIQAIINNSLTYLETKEEGKNKYFSFKDNPETKLLLKQIELEEFKVLTAERGLDRLDELESQSMYILREAYAKIKNLAMLWSIGKDSTVLLWLARKSFGGHVPFPLVHIDTSFKIPEMIEYRDTLAKKYKLTMIYGQNKDALKNKKTFPHKNVSRIQCCKNLKSDALKNTLSGKWPRFALNHEKGVYEEDSHKEPYTGVIVGVRSDEEGSRSKERYFSPRDKENEWNVGDQPPELWNQFKTDFPEGEHIRIHPLLDWTELDIWRYIEREQIPTVSLYYDQGKGTRYRSLGCYPCTKPIESTAKNVREIIVELESGKFSDIAERSGREQDQEDGGSLETLRKDGYM